MQSKRSTPEILGVAVALSVGVAASSCATKTSECSKLVEVTQTHNPQLSTAMERLSTAQSNPKVLDEFAVVVRTASEDVAQLAFEDSQVAGFAKEYLQLLADADQFARTLGDATRGNDTAAMDRAQAEGDQVAATEADIVARVNAYCQGR